MPLFRGALTWLRMRTARQTRSRLASLRLQGEGSGIAGRETVGQPEGRAGTELRNSRRLAPRAVSATWLVDLAGRAKASWETARGVRGTGQMPPRPAGWADARAGRGRARHFPWDGP